ncbi:MAG TPA: transglutaminase-like domain-containing protein [Terriglobia bacterium]|nr:transglutaminase-like domain-containing protein [Terriglobia bacterium]
MCPHKSSAKLLAGFLLIAFSLPALSQEISISVPLEDIWADLKLAGQPAGYYHEKTERDEVGRILTSVETIVVINRLNSRVEIRTTSEYTESKDAQLVAIKSETSSSKQSTFMEVTVGDGLLLVRTTSGGKSYDRKVPYSGRLLGPEAVRRVVLAGLKLPGDTISFQIFVPELGSVASVTRKAIGTEKLMIDGKQLSGLRVEDVTEKLPGKTKVWLDSSARFLRQVQESPFGEVDIIRRVQKPTQADRLPVTALPTEAYSRAVARANIRLPHERSIEHMKIRINHRKPELGWPDLEADNQKVLEKSPESLVLEIWRPTPKTKEQGSLESSSELAPFLAANPLLQSDDAEVKRILREIGKLDSDVFQSSLALQRWTAENMKFDSGIAVASASEVARDRKGTCFGYSVLLGSLARAAGIPSRFKMGYVYASGMWGGHAWVEVLVGNDWIPIDAAAYSPGPADAARFSAFTSSLEEGISTGIGALGQLYGNVDIQILEYTLKGRRVTVPIDAPPYVTTDNTYRNQWLGLTVVKPDSFRFTRLDAVWPDYTIVAMEGPQHQTVEIQKLPYSPRSGTDPVVYLRQAGISGVQKRIRVSDFPGLETSSPEDAALSFVDEDQVWIVRAKGTDAPSVLHEVAFRMALSR